MSNEIEEPVSKEEWFAFLRSLTPGQRLEVIRQTKAQRKLEKHMELKHVGGGKWVRVPK